MYDAPLFLLLDTKNTHFPTRHERPTRCAAYDRVMQRVSCIGIRPSGVAHHAPPAYVDAV